jgi:molecular chaperone HscA
MLFNISEPESILHTKPRLAVGIDFGTTNSLIAVVRNGQCEVLADVDGEVLLPSVVAYGADGEVFVGKEAISHPMQIRSIKRLLGKTAIDIKNGFDLQQKANRVTITENGEIIIQSGMISKLDIEVAADILKALKIRAEFHLDCEVSEAVITVPTYFDDGARNAVKTAAQLAGIKVLRLLNEPTAAAYAYGLEDGPEGTYAVYDLGGGTFDVSVLKMQKGIFHVIATSGDANLGGDDFDIKLVDLICQRKGMDLQTLLPNQVRDVLLLARNIKEQLTDNEIYSKADINISRAQFEQCIASLVDATIHITKKAVEDSGTIVEQIILVGGSTRTPIIKSKLKESFKVLDNINPEQIVVQGAAMKACALSGGEGGSLLIDVTPLSLGIELADGLNEVIIPRNTTIPATYKHNFATGTDNQTAFVIHVLQGEGTYARECRSLAKFELSDLPPLPAGTVKLELTFQLDADGILTVTAKDLYSNIEKQVLVKPSYGLSQVELLKLRML